MKYMCVFSSDLTLTLLENIDNIFARGFRSTRQHGYENEALSQGSGDQFKSAILKCLVFVCKKPSFFWVLQETRSKNTNINGNIFKLNKMEKRFIYLYSFLNC